jgi:hypothetical protein
MVLLSPGNRILEDLVSARIRGYAAVVLVSWLMRQQLSL